MTLASPREIIIELSAERTILRDLLRRAYTELQPEHRERNYKEARERREQLLAEIIAVFK